MTNSAVAIVVLAAGHGTRMKSSLPKVLHPIGGLAMLGHVLNTGQKMAPAHTVVVIGAQAPEVGDAATSLQDNIQVAVQDPPQGTGHAVLQALPALEQFEGVVIVLYADTPLVSAATLRALATSIDEGATAAVLGFRPETPGAYGRLKRNAQGALDAIVEAGDATPEELDIKLCNSGVMAIRNDFLKRALPKVEPNNAKQEYYLTDLIAMARSENLTCAAVEADADEVMGVNSRIELSQAEAIFQNQRRMEAMASGVTLIDPDTVYFSYDTEIGNDVTVEPGVFFGPGVSIQSGAVVKAYSHIEGAELLAGAQVGPFARLRPGARLGENAKVGNFVEIKKSDLGNDAKVSHLTYLGDASIGPRANIGAGTITCNYDGFNKHKTTIGEDAFVGSNSALVAPVVIGTGAYVGSGSVITKDVEAGDLAVARGRQAVIKGWAARFRSAQEGKK